MNIQVFSAYWACYHAYILLTGLKKKSQHSVARKCHRVAFLKMNAFTLLRKPVRVRASKKHDRLITSSPKGLFIDTSILFSLFSLTILEIILGIDNLVILFILNSRAPKQHQVMTMRIGLSLAWMMRLALLAGGVWLSKLTRPLFSLAGMDFSVRDLFMLIGGLFLLIKSIIEIKNEFNHHDQPNLKTKTQAIFLILIQIILLDIVFAVDSILTAIGLTNIYWVMATAIPSPS
mgnify:CR=1 FL=1